MRKTLEEYLRALAEQAIDHKVRASLSEKGEVMPSFLWSNMSECDHLALVGSIK